MFMSMCTRVLCSPVHSAGLPMWRRHSPGLCLRQTVLRDPPNPPGISLVVYIGINLHSLTLYSFTPLLLKPPQGGARVSALWDHARAREISGDLERSRESGIPTRHAQPPGHTQQAAANRVLGAIGAFTPCTVHAVYQGESCHRHMNGYQP